MIGHPDDCACFACKLRSIQFAGPPTATSLWEKRRWGQDMPAYKRLRDNGLQPLRIEGCAKLERDATTQMEIEMGHLFTKEEMPQARAGMEMAKEMREYMADNNIPLLQRPPT